MARVQSYPISLKRQNALRDAPMNVVMITNTYLPHVGGVARSVEAFASEYRSRGHRVLIVAPEFPGRPSVEKDVVRLPAIQKFNGSDFSVRLPIPGLLSKALLDFNPHIVHSHHPFLLGDTALRIAARWNVPLVFTHHTMYERYTHYVPGDSLAIQRFVIELTIGYANLVDQVFAPSESVAALLRERGVASPVEVVPTGVDMAAFATGDGRGFRRELGIPDEAFVIGHVGRLAPEKNLDFLTEAVASFLKCRQNAHFLLVGNGPSLESIRTALERRNLSARAHLSSVCQGQKLVDAYHAMDVFAFASLTETQGMVLTEAMACGVPVVAIDAPGAREVVRDRKNGRLLATQQVDSFVDALAWIANRERGEWHELRRSSRRAAESFAMPRCADRALKVYDRLIRDQRIRRDLGKGMTLARAWKTALGPRRFAWWRPNGTYGPTGPKPRAKQSHGPSGHDLQEEHEETA